MYFFLCPCHSHSRVASFFQSNIGESAILIHTGPPSEVALDISQLMSAAGGETMAVEIDECIFRVCPV
jgi:hypothetical protein